MKKLNSISIVIPAYNEEENIASTIYSVMSSDYKNTEILVINDGSKDKTLEVIRRGVKQRKDAIEQFEKGGRADLAESEKAELALLQKYLPAQMNESEITPLVEAKIKELGVQDKTGAGKLLGALMKDLKGKADGAMVKAVVDKLLP